MLEMIRTPDTDRNDCPQVRRSVNVLPTIIVKSYNTLMSSNFRVGRLGWVICPAVPQPPQRQ
jgi:hypothetical protein